MKAHLDYYLLFLCTRTSRGTLKRTQDLGEKRHTLQPGSRGMHRCATKELTGLCSSSVTVVSYDLVVSHTKL